MKRKLFGIPLYLFLIILVIALGIVVIYFVISKRGRNSNENTAGQFQSKKATSLSKEVISKVKFLRKITSVYMPELNPFTRDMIIAQSMHETGKFTSGLVKNNSNLFGMRPAVKRESDQDGEKGGYASYENWDQSVRDMKLWLEYAGNYHNFPSTMRYVQDLKDRQYFEAPRIIYHNAVKTYFDQIQSL